MTVDYQRIIDKYYPAGSALRDIYMRHCNSVAEKALQIALEKHLNLDTEKIRAAAMLHDIGIFLTNAPGIECYGSEPYICHGFLGADLLRKEGVEEEIASVAERHTGAGITPEDIRSLNLPLPYRDFMPHTLLQRLICYADKFYSKNGDMKEKSLDRVLHSMSRHSSDTLNRFLILHREFSLDANNNTD